MSKNKTARKHGELVSEGVHTAQILTPWNRTLHLKARPDSRTLYTDGNGGEWRREGSTFIAIKGSIR